MKLVRKELEVLGTGNEAPLKVEEVPILSGTATELEKEGSSQKTSPDVVLVEVSLPLQGCALCARIIFLNQMM